MIETIVPAFYPAFTCKAERCQHTCCRGWEIDIDAQTAVRYQSMEGALGDRLHRNIVTGQGQSHFRMDETGRCPFLRADGLCQIIREAGEEELCEICKMHPRFFTYVGNHELAGTGLSCERSTELLLATDEPLRFGCLDSSGQVIGAAQLELADLLVKLGLAIPTEELQYEAVFTLEDAQFVLDCLAQTEPIDAVWQQMLQELQQRLPALIEGWEASVDSRRLNRIFHYILYRQLEQAAVHGMGQVVSFACLNTDFILLVSLLTGNLPESVRRWSEQIEYDTDNVRLLYTML